MFACHKEQVAEALVVQIACFAQDLLGIEGGAQDRVVARESAVRAVVHTLVGNVEGGKEADRFAEIAARDLSGLASERF